MRKMLVLFVFLTGFVFSGGVLNANAALIITSDNLAVFDTTSNLYWWRNLSTFSGDINGQVNGVNMTYAAQNNLIATLSGGTWHMATWDDMLTLKNDNTAANINSNFLPIGNSMISNPGDPPVFVNVFVGRYDLGVGNMNVTQHYVGTMDWDTTHGVQNYPQNGSSIDLSSAASDDGYGGIGAWVVTANYTPVPLPPTVLLLGSGLLGLAGWRRFRKS